MVYYEPMSNATADDFRALLVDLKISSKKIDQIMEQYVEDIEAVTERLYPFDVEVTGARIAVEHVEIYGLTIGVSATGRAATVSCDDGFEITA